MILVIAEQKDGKLNRPSWETIAAAQQLAAGSMPIKVAVVGHGVAAVAAELAQAAVAEVIVIDHAALAHYTPDGFVQALEQVVGQETVRSFILESRGQRLLVRNRGPKPDSFRDRSEVVAEGRLVIEDGEPVLEATGLMAKCPSKYHGAPKDRLFEGR